MLLATRSEATIIGPSVFHRWGGKKRGGKHGGAKWSRQSNLSAIYRWRETSPPSQGCETRRTEGGRAHRFIHPRWARDVEENADTCARGLASSKYRKVRAASACARRAVRRTYGRDIPKLRAFVLLPVRRRAVTFSMKTALPSYRGAQPRTGAAARIAHTRDTCAPDGSPKRLRARRREHRQTTPQSALFHRAKFILAQAPRQHRSSPCRVE